MMSASWSAGNARSHPLSMEHHTWEENNRDHIQFRIVMILIRLIWFRNKWRMCMIPRINLVRASTTEEYDTPSFCSLLDDDLK